MPGICVMIQRGALSTTIRQTASYHNSGLLLVISTCEIPPTNMVPKLPAAASTPSYNEVASLLGHENDGCPKIRIAER